MEVLKEDDILSYLTTEPADSPHQSADVSHLNVVSQPNNINPQNAMNQQNCIVPQTNVAQPNKVNLQNAMNQQNNLNRQNCINPQTNVAQTNNVNPQNAMNQQNNMNQQSCINPQTNVAQSNNVNLQNAMNQQNCIVSQTNIAQPNKVNLQNAVNQQNNMNQQNCISPQTNVAQSNNVNQQNNMIQQNCISSQTNVSQSNNVNPQNAINQQNNMNQQSCINPQTNVAQSSNINAQNAMNQQNNMNQQNCINPQTNVAQSNNVNPQNKMNQQNNMNQQNCINPQTNVVQSNLLPQTTNDLCMPTNSDDILAELNSETKSKGEKKCRKIKCNKSQWRKEKDNKYLNKPYRNYKGIEIKSKEFVDYDCHCTMKCKEVLSTNERKQEFQKFWELGSYEAQAIFLIARVDEQTTKKSAKKKEGDEIKDDDTSSSEKKKSKRQFSRTYILKSKQVCRDMFVKTLGITSKRINTALVKMRSKSLIDYRGLSQGGKNKISEERYDEVVQHIKKMPRYRCSHMQGKHDADYLNFPPELSLSKMYELYTKEVEHPVSLSMYKKIYYGKFNFKAKGVKREVCNMCKEDRKLKNAEIKKQQTMEKLSLHCPNNQIMFQDQYRTTNFMHAPTINCSQPWLPPNFQMPQHNPTHYFDQPMIYDIN